MIYPHRIIICQVISGRMSGDDMGAALQFSAAPLVGDKATGAGAGFSFDRASLTSAAYGSLAPNEPKKIRVYVPKNFIHRKIWASVDSFSNVFAGSSGNVVMAAALRNTMRFYLGSHLVGKLESLNVANASNGAKPVLGKSEPRLFGAAGFSYNNVQRPSCVSFYDAGAVFSTWLASWLGGHSTLIMSCSGVQAISCGMMVNGEFDSIELEVNPQAWKTTIPTVDGWPFDTSPPLLYNINIAVLSQNEKFANN